jgi:hypothetical protein
MKISRRSNLLPPRHRGKSALVAQGQGLPCPIPLYGQILLCPAGERRPYWAEHRKDCGMKAEHVNHVQDFENSVGRFWN